MRFGKIKCRHIEQHRLEVYRSMDRRQTGVALTTSGRVDARTSSYGGFTVKLRGIYSTVQLGHKEWRIIVYWVGGVS